MAVFTLFTATLITGLRRQNRSTRANARAKSVAFTIAIAYGALLEVGQGWLMQDRTPDFFDFLANVLGVFFGLILFRLIYGPELSRS